MRTTKARRGRGTREFRTPQEPERKYAGRKVAGGTETGSQVKQTSVGISNTKQER